MAGGLYLALLAGATAKRKAAAKKRAAAANNAAAANKGRKTRRF